MGRGRSHTWPDRRYGAFPRPLAWEISGGAWSRSLSSHFRRDGGLECSQRRLGSKRGMGDEISWTRRIRTYRTPWSLSSSHHVSVVLTIPQMERSHRPSRIFLKRRARINSVIVRRVLLQTYDNVARNHTFFMAAALSYYFLLSLFPTFILLSAIMAYLSLPDLLNQAFPLLAHLLPSDSRGLVDKVLVDVITVNRATLLSIGIVATLWTSSSALTATIEALNIAYGVCDDRPFWKIRFLSVGLAFTVGFLMFVAHSVMIVGPRFGEWIASKAHVSELFILLWRYLRWPIGCGVVWLAIEILYFFAPNVRHRFRDIWAGAVVAVVAWIGLSSLLGIYFRHFAGFNKIYGTLGGAIALMVWLYWTGFALLVGAILNAELAKACGEGERILKFSKA